MFPVPAFHLTLKHHGAGIWDMGGPAVSGRAQTWAQVLHLSLPVLHWLANQSSLIQFFSSINRDKFYLFYFSGLNEDQHERMCLKVLYVCAYLIFHCGNLVSSLDKFPGSGDCR